MNFKTFAAKVGCLAVGGVLAVVALGPGPASSSQASGSGGDSKPIYCPKGDESGYDARDLLGRNVPTAKDRAQEENCEVRVVKRDGKDRLITDDLRNNRINVVVRNDRVKRIRGVY